MLVLMSPLQSHFVPSSRIRLLNRILILYLTQIIISFWHRVKNQMQWIYLLKGIDPGFSIDICTWGQFKSNMPILYKWFQTHVLFHDYLTEIVICDKANCNICRAFGVGLRTSMTNDGRLRDVLLRPMDRPVNVTNSWPLCGT